MVATRAAGPTSRVAPTRPPGLAAAPPRSTRVKVQVTPAAFGATLLIAIGLVLWLVGDESAYLGVVTALLVALVVDAVIAYRGLARVDPHLDHGGEAVAGERTDWLLRVGGVRRPVAVTPAHLPRPPAVLVADAEPGLVPFPPFTRGVVHFLVVDLATTGPIGLFGAARRFQVFASHPVHVGPRPAPFPLDWPTPKAVGFGMAEVAPRGDDLFRAIRPYLRGDERRRIDWKATAHHGELMVRESDGTGIVALQVVVDLGPPGPQAEIVAAAAAALAQEAVEKRWHVQLVTQDVAPTPGAVVDLGAPLGFPPRAVPGPPQPARARTALVSGPADIGHQLATAAYGRPVVPPWSGLTCIVGPGGVEWP